MFAKVKETNAMISKIRKPTIDLYDLKKPVLLIGLLYSLMIGFVIQNFKSTINLFEQNESCHLM